jgi:hypothetical protein
MATLASRRRGSLGVLASRNVKQKKVAYRDFAAEVVEPGR